MTNFLHYIEPLTLRTLESNMIKIEDGVYKRGVNDFFIPNGGKEAMMWAEYPEDIYIDSKEHKVKLDSFEICRFPVSQALWQEVMGNNPAIIRSKFRAVHNVSWTDCQLFLKNLNEERETHFRLPTEAEWEFAARGMKNRPWIYAGSLNPKEVSIFKGNSTGINQPLGQKLPNELGLFDMSGNVYEWCQDWYEGYPDKWDESFDLPNPKGPDVGSFRVIRGGFWNNQSSYCHVAHRVNNRPEERKELLGFRLARSIRSN